MATRPRRTTRWTPAAIPVGILLMALGAWAFFVPLVGPYFDFGFYSSHTWVFSAHDWELSLLPGIAIFVGGVLMTLPAAGPGWLGGLLAVVGGTWLLVGPSLFPLWTAAGSAVRPAVPHTQTIDALTEIGYFYGVGALTLWLAAFAQGLLSRRTVIQEEPVIQETPIERRERTITHA